MVDVPVGVATVALTAPAACAGAVATMVVLLVTVKVAALPPKATAVAPVKPLPVSVTAVPPAVGPPVGLRLVMVGTWAV